MIEYTKERPLRVATAFSGYDSQKMALERLHKVFPDFCYELVVWSEIDKNAIAAHNAVFPEDKDNNLGDISKIDWSKAPDFDLFTYSFPCQDISSSGKQRGFKEGAGTRSSLLWECKKAIEAKKPRFLMMENVKAIVSAKFMPFLRQWQAWLHQQGYENFTQVLNASDFNVPQNRERMFMISILRTDSEPNLSFNFPKKMKLERRIKDILEPNVDESFYMSGKALEYFCRVNNGLNGSDESSCIGRVSNSQDGVVSGVNAIAPTLTAGHANQPKVLIEEINDSGTSNTIKSVNRDNLLIKPNVLRQERTEQCKKIRNTNGDKGMKFNQRNKEYNPRTDGVSNTLSTSTKDNMLATPELRIEDGCIVDKEGRKYRIRKLTPTECFRLMDVEDEDIEKMKQAGIVKTNLYKLAGNSICVGCMYHIFRKLFIKNKGEFIKNGYKYKQIS